jgi:hypothetical protein
MGLSFAEKEVESVSLFPNYPFHSGWDRERTDD